MYNITKIAIVIPSYKVVTHILQVIESIDKCYDFIYVIDDCCPENSGQFVVDNCIDKRVKLIFNVKNRGVGEAGMHGYQQAKSVEAEIIVKIDGDGQMNPKLIPLFINPIISGNADYTKGIRFYYIFYITQMPTKRLLKIRSLSFVSKFLTGYRNIFDSTNGFTAINSKTPLTLQANTPFQTQYKFL